MDGSMQQVTTGSLCVYGAELNRIFLSKVHVSDLSTCAVVTPLRQIGTTKHMRGNSDIGDPLPPSLPISSGSLPPVHATRSNY